MRGAAPGYLTTGEENDVPLGFYMLNCAVVLIGDSWDDRARCWNHRVPVGTGFIVRVPSETKEDTYHGYHGYLLTADHVSSDQPELELDIPYPDDTGKYYPRVEAPSFVQPDERLDLAYASFSPPKDYVVTALEVGHQVVPELPSMALLAAQFHYVGYLDPLKLVMARSGTLGRINEMLPNDDYEYLTHIGDVRSYDGFSGSPCFVEYSVPALKPKPPPFPMDDDTPVGRMRYLHLLCGMFTGHLEKPIPGGDVSRHGVGYIMSSDELWRVLMSDKLRQERRETDEAR